MPDKQILTDFTLADADEMVFNYFDSVNPFFVESKSGIIKVNIVLAAGERWKLARKTGFRDDLGKLILPLASIHRTGLGRTATMFGQGATFNEVTVKRQISPKTSQLKNAAKNRKYNKNTQPIFDVYTIPAPKTIKMSYAITIWTQFQTQMNECVESFFNGNLHPLDFYIPSESGFWMVGSIEEDSIQDESNKDEFTEEERIIKYTIPFTTYGHIMTNLADKNKGIKKYSSGTSKVQFKLAEPTSIQFKSKEEIDNFFSDNSANIRYEQILSGFSQQSVKDLVVDKLLETKKNKEEKKLERQLTNSEKDRLLISAGLEGLAKDLFKSNKVVK